MPICEADAWRLQYLTDTSKLPDLDEGGGPRERRWLDLYDKHETARRRFLTSNKTLH